MLDSEAPRLSIFCVRVFAVGNQDLVVWYATVSQVLRLRGALIAKAVEYPVNVRSISEPCMYAPKEDYRLSVEEA